MLCFEMSITKRLLDERLLLMTNQELLEDLKSIDREAPSVTDWEARFLDTLMGKLESGDFYLSAKQLENAERVRNKYKEFV